MKRLIMFLSVMAMFIAIPVFAFAQTGDPPTNPISMEMFASLTALAAAIVAITAFVKNTFNTSGIITDIVSWVIGPLLAIAGWYFKLGMFEGILWYMAIIYGVLAAFYANKGWDLFSIILGKKDVNYKPVR